MAAAFLLPQSISRFPVCFLLNRQPKLGNPILSPREIADRSATFCSWKAPLQLTVSSITSDGNRKDHPPRKRSASGRTEKGDTIKKSFDDKAADLSKQEEIIALFKRIQSSISKGESGSTKKRKSRLSKDKPIPESVVLNALSQSRKDTKDKSGHREAENASRTKRDLSRKKQGMRDRADAAAAKVEFKLTRPPSSFVRRSPIPSPTAPRGKNFELDTDVPAKTATIEESESPEVEKLKLPELKELARARGIKGYSKLKKSELVQLLSS